MVQAISSSASAAAYAGSAPAFASLQAQLQRYEQQLSDCVNCASAKTPKGKADIEAINARIGQVKGRIEQADAGKEAAPQPEAVAPVADPSRSLGGRIDVFA